MEKNIVIAVALSILVIISVVQFFQLNSIKNSASATGAVVATGSINTAGWTEDEVMNYEMHGIIPARFAESSPENNPTGVSMVGGC